MRQYCLLHYSLLPYHCPPWLLVPLWLLFPAPWQGYPESVTADYLEFQYGTHCR